MPRGENTKEGRKGFQPTTRVGVAPPQSPPTPGVIAHALPTPASHPAALTETWDRLYQTYKANLAKETGLRAAPGDEFCDECLSKAVLVDDDDNLMCEEHYDALLGRIAESADEEYAYDRDRD